MNQIAMPMDFPKIKEVHHVDLLQSDSVELESGLKIYFLPAGKQEIIKLDMIFDAGNVRSKDPVLPGAVNALINDGTVNRNSSEIANIIDGYGAFYVPDIHKDYSQISLYCLNRYASELFTLVNEMVTSSVFPEDEIELYKRNMKQRFIVENEKVNVQSYRAFLNRLYGESSPYADHTQAEDFDALNKESLDRFYSDFVRSKPQFIVVSGFVDDTLRSQVIEAFSSLSVNSAGNDLRINADHEFQSDWLELSGNGNNQVSMRIGRKALSANHPDYWGLSLLNTLLGGYFGSRLNKVIREEKGLTYGIHSHITKWRDVSHLSIHAELNANNWKEAYTSVLDVFEDLKTKEVADEELTMVRRYIKGSLLQSLDGAFSFSSYFKNSLLFDLDPNRVNGYIEYLDSVLAQDLKEIANRYLHEEDFCKIVAGV